MPSIVVSSEMLIGLAGVILSLFFSYFPNVNVWFAGKPEAVKKQLMLVFIFVLTVIIFGLGCFNLVLITNFTCSAKTAIDFVWMFILGVISNQSIFAISPQTNAVKQTKDKAI